MENNKSHQNRENTEKEQLNTKQKDVPEPISNEPKKSISIFRIYYHLSTTRDIILIIIATIASLCSGLGNPILSLCFGEAVSVLGDSLVFEVIKMEPHQKLIFYDNYESSVKTMVIRFLYISIISFVVFAVGHALWNYLGLKQMHYLKQQYFTLILKQKQDWFDSKNTFEFSTKVQSQLETIEKGLGENTGNFFQHGSQLISGLVVAFISSWKLTLLMLTVSPIILICMFYLVGVYTKAYINSTAAYEKAGGIAEEILYNIKTVSSFANYDFEKSRFENQILEVKNINNSKGLKAGFLISTATFFNYATLTICACYAQKMIRNREWNNATNNYFKGGDITAVNWSTMHAIFAITFIVPTIKAFRETSLGISEYFDLYEKTNKVIKPSTIRHLLKKDIKGKIEFRNVSFSYNSSKKILRNISFCLSPGKKYAFVGESGCGKTTIINLIERLYEIQEGNIYLDDININELDIKFYRSLIGYVQQEPMMFDMPIKDNIIFGREDILKEVSKIEKKTPDILLKEACDNSYSSEFINNLPDKMDYEVGVKGSKLSGGQKQRIAIARAIISKPKLLILDEATSALDYKSEKEVQKALDLISSTSNITIIAIAHRLNTIQNADQIFLVKDGYIFETGTYEELFKKQNSREFLKNQVIEKTTKGEELLIIKNEEVKGSKTKQKNKQENEKATKEKGKKEGGLIGKTLRLLKDNKLNTIISVISALFSGFMNPLIGFSLAKCVNALTSPDFKVVKDDGILYALLYLLFAFLNWIFTFLKIWKIGEIGDFLTYKMRKDLINKYIHSDMSFHDDKSNSPGALLTKLSIDSVQLPSMINGLLGDFINTLGCTILGLSLGFIYDWRIALITIVGMICITVSDFLSIKTRPYGRTSYIKANVEAGNILSESVSNTKTIFTYNFEDEAIKLYMTKLQKVTKDFTKDSILKGVFKGLKFFFYFFNDVYIFYAAGQFIINESLTFEDMNLCMTCVMVANNGIITCLEGFADYKKAKVAFQNLFRVMDLKDKIDTTEFGNKNKKGVNGLKGKIEFKNVSFSYPNKRDKLVLDNVSFTILPGEKVWLVGHSGSGKSTIIQLIERFYDVDKGVILIDDINIKEYNLIELRKKIGLVSQEPVLFKRSLVENIRYGNLLKNKDETLGTAKKFYLEHLIPILESNEKITVSGGERQRIAVARVFCKEPNIVLLDEPTSALDKASEKLVQNSIDFLKKGKTSISITHKFEYIDNSDLIYVIEEGKIVEKGNHQQLLQLKGNYYALCKLNYDDELKQ